MKTNPKQTICDEAERLWEVWMKTKEPVDYARYVHHIENCPEDFIELKKMRAINNRTNRVLRQCRIMRVI